MPINSNLQEWIKDNYLQVSFIKDNILEIDGVGKFLIITDKDFVFDDRFILNLDDIEIDLLDEVDYILYKFGAFWFYIHKEDEITKLNLFKYLGTTATEKFNIPFLGVHGKYEICNGSRDYNDWVKKAKFLGYSSLGICENQTLAGTYNFQKACDKYEIKALIGRTNKVKSQSGSYYFVKTFAINLKGWQDLLRIHKIEKIDRANDGEYINEEELFQYSLNLFHIITHETDLNLIDLTKYHKNKTFYQFNTVKYTFDDKDQEHLLNLKNYLDNYLDKIEPIVIQDAYYLDKGDHVVKSLLNRISGHTVQFSSKDEYMKPYEEMLQQIVDLFKENDTRLETILDLSFKNLQFIQDTCEYKVKRQGMHLPKYKMNEDEKLLYENNEDMFFALVEKGFNEKIRGKVTDEQIYIDRLNKEIEVLEEGGVLDYFLILYDIVNFSAKNGSIPSLGRGSAAGSLIAFIFGIVLIDPIKYNLLFERFLNKARLLSGSLPDIDFDCPSFFRSKIIDYLINKYGKDYVACIGTAQNLKLKSALKDLLKLKGVDFKESNSITAVFQKEHDIASIEGLFELALKERKIKEVLEKYPEIVYEIYLLIFQPRSVGIHAAGVVITPEYNAQGEKTELYDYVPTRFSDGQLVTEWEKDAVEEIGLLKADFLGLKQLDKIIRMNQLIEENGKSYHVFEDIDLADNKVFQLFQTGTTEDIFQFNTDVQKNYLLQLNPTNLNDLVAANALNRPGAMESNSHHAYIKFKNGTEPYTLPPLLEDILKDTFSIFTYQEQASLAYQRISNCDLNEADNFRKVVSKSKPGKIDPNIEKYKENFITAYTEKINDNVIPSEIWSKIIGFSSYGFNKSHAVCYAATGYWAAYYKTYFPVEFYTTSLEAANAASAQKKEDLLRRIINEIQSQELVNLNPPDINKSGWQYSMDVQKNAIYWSLISVNFAGQKAVETLLEEREANGKYFSFEEFLERAKNFKVNKRIIINFILSGCFDEIESITEEKERIKLLQFYCDKIKEPLPDEIQHHKDINKNHFWILMQKQLCGLGNINYEGIYKTQKVEHWLSCSYMDAYLMQDDLSVGKNIVVGGILEALIERDTKKGTKMCSLTINSNSQSIYVTLWHEQYIAYKEVLESSMFQPIFLNGMVVKDTYKRCNVIHGNQNTKIIKS